MSQDPTTLRDTSGVQYRIGTLLGRGGQGEVFTVQGRELAVKRLYAGSSWQRKRLEESITRVRRLPLEGLPLAGPLRSLAPPDVGYVMELMTGMTSLSALLAPPRDRQAALAEWYVETGSLERRLCILARLGEILAQVHGRGLTFGDLSPGNVMISETVDRDIVWLIDCDNLIEGAGGQPFYTEGYGAPELLRGHPANSLTDAWSFAVLVFETLCLFHPLIGDDVHDGEPELEERALKGELPWVDDPSGVNAATRGLPREMVLSPALQELADSCFGASRLSHLERPGVGAWAEKLRRASRQLLRCGGCGSSFYLNARACPWCGDPRPPFVTGSIYLRDPSLRDPARNPHHLVCAEAGRPHPQERVSLQLDRPLTVGRDLLGPLLGEHSIDLRLEGDALVVEGDDGCPFELWSGSKSPLPLGGRAHRILLTPGGAPWWITPRSAHDLHRALRLDGHRREGA